MIKVKPRSSSDRAGRPDGISRHAAGAPAHSAEWKPHRSGKTVIGRTALGDVSSLIGVSPQIAGVSSSPAPSGITAPGLKLKGHSRAEAYLLAPTAPAGQRQGGDAYRYQQDRQRQ
jgi:hypothetical protein